MNRSFHCGVDIGASATKLVLLDADGAVAARAIRNSGVDYAGTAQACLDEARAAAGLDGDPALTVATGYGRDNVDFADETRTEIHCHGAGGFHHARQAVSIIDIGGQDNKVIHLNDQGKRLEFRMNRKCAAGTGAFIEEIALRLDRGVADLNGLAGRTDRSVQLGSFCTVFAKTEILSHLRQGAPVEEIVRGAFESVVQRIIEMDPLDGLVMATGGVVAHNPVIVDILAERLGCEVIVPDAPQFTGALGAALTARKLATTVNEENHPMLDGLFRPRAVGVIGASENPYSIGHIVVKNLVHYGFKGPVFPINPKGGTIRSMQAYKSILDVPCDNIDLVNISIKNVYVPGVLEECGRKGVKFAIVHSAGFKEVGPEGVALERKMVETAHEHSIRIFGPNSQGIQNADPEVSVYANFTFVPQKPGNISIIAQGGGMGEMLKLHLHNVGLGHRMYCSYGNECDLTMPEILAYYGQDEGTRVIMMQTESFKDPRAFLETAAAITPHKPILAIKAGRTAEGSQAVSSHTGALVDQVKMAEAMYRKAGVVPFTDTDEMIKAAIAMSTQNPPAGDRIGIITNTGGPGIQAVDEAVGQGLVLAEWSDEGRARLAETQFAEASLGNPVDVVATANQDHYHAAISTLLAEAETDMVMVFFVTAPFTDIDAIARRIKEAAGESDKPVVVVVETYSENYRLIDQLRAADLPVFEFPEDGVRAMAAMRGYARLRDRERGEVPQLDVKKAAAESVITKYRGKDAYLTQEDAFAVLSAYGIRSPRMAELSTPGGLDGAAEITGFPCVLKVESADVVHKSDAGGVVLGIIDEQQLRAEYDAMLERFGTGSSCLLMEQVPPGRELIAGVAASEGLGSLVMFGLGGVFVEVLKDVAAAVAPLSRPEASELVRAIKGFDVLTGLRGQDPVDLDALTDMLVRVSVLAADFPEILEMDLNPIFAYPPGREPVAVDVRLKVS